MKRAVLQRKRSRALGKLHEGSAEYVLSPQLFKAFFGSDNHGICFHDISTLFGIVSRTPKVPVQFREEARKFLDEALTDHDRHYTRVRKDGKKPDALPACVALKGHGTYTRTILAHERFHAFEVNTVTRSRDLASDACYPYTNAAVLDLGPAGYAAVATLMRLGAGTPQNAGSEVLARVAELEACPTKRVGCAEVHAEIRNLDSQAHHGTKPPVPRSIEKVATIIKRKYGTVRNFVQEIARSCVVDLRRNQKGRRR